MRSGSRSPRREDENERDMALKMACGGYVEGEGPEMPDWEGAGLPPPGSKGHMTGQMQSQRAFLEQFVKGPPKDLPPAPREFAAGMPLEAARALLLGPVLASRPWLGLPAHLACLSVASRLFAIIKDQEDPCGRLCTSAKACAGSLGERPSASCLFEAANAWQLAASAASGATDSLEAMVRNEPVVCCVLLDDFVAVLEEADTGIEAEEEVGAHCVMVVGGDLSGPQFVVFDPWGAQGGEVAYWTLHDLEKAVPTAWVTLVPSGLA